MRFIVALPALIKLVLEMLGFVRKHFGDNPKAALEAHREAYKLVLGAKTKHERVQAARAIAAAIARL